MRLLPKKYDFVLLVSILALLSISLVMIASIGVPKSIELSVKLSGLKIPYPDCSLKEVDCYFLLKKHVMRVGLGLLLMMLAWRFPFKWIKKSTPIFYAGGLILMGYVIFSGESNGTFATQWINLPGLPFADSLQPSELMKLGLIFYLSYFFTEKVTDRDMDDPKEAFTKFGILMGLPLMLVVLQKDLGGAMVMTFIGVSIFFVAGARWKHLAVASAVVAVLVTMAVFTVDRVQNRLLAIVHPPENCQEGACWQNRQANIAIGSGGFWGKGLTQGIQKSYWLPQATDDFMFAASAEELGFIRTSMVVILYFCVVYRGYFIASQASNRFSMLVASGVSTWFAAQSFINIMVNTAIFPITGITLPFMSYGGSSMVATLLAVGILLNISGEGSNYAYSAHGGWDRRSHSTQSRSRLRYRSF